MFTRMGFPEKKGLYDPSFEKDACGFGFIADINNEPKHEIVHQALDIVHKLDHRGAIGADPLVRRAVDGPIRRKSMNIMKNYGFWLQNRLFWSRTGPQRALTPSPGHFKCHAVAAKGARCSQQLSRERTLGPCSEASGRVAAALLSQPRASQTLLTPLRATPTLLSLAACQLRCSS